MKKKIFTSIGLMSGTSLDGVDLSVIKSDGNLGGFSSVGGIKLKKKLLKFEQNF